MTFAPTPRMRSLLVIAHPGHELRLLGWLRKTRPLVAILTDGSGSTGQSRLDLSMRLVEENGGEVVVAGRFTEPDLYALLMRGESAPLVEFARELARLIDKHQVAEITCDAVEGYHPGHDLCLPLTRAAARLRCTGTEMLRHLEYRVVGDPRPGGTSEEIVLDLDTDVLRDKIERAHRYAAQSGTVLAQEVQHMFDTYGEDAFRFEVLRPAGAESPQLHAGLRYYEMRGEQQVQAGRYREALRYARHVLPVEAALHAC